MTFANLGLSLPILQAITEQGYDQPTPIQAEAIPAVLEGQDVMAAAQTGTGKTAGFTLPILELLSRGERAGPNQVRALILTPTRELAAQVGESVETYGRHLPIRSAVVFGGVKVNPQMISLRRGADILVATPGRLIDLYNQNAVKFKHLEVLVLDEADRMLDMGFIHDIRRILALLPKRRQNLMFSATFSDEIRQLAKTIVNQPVEISVSPRNTPAKSVQQWVYPVDKNQKPALLTQLIRKNNWSQVLVFTRTKHGANRLTRHLEGKGIQAAAIHGNKSQGARTKALANFKSNEITVLVATDIAARGLDIDQLPQVVNFDLPNVPEDYVHRIGRTGRAGSEGQAVSLVCADESKQLQDIERLINELLPREMIAGFEPVNAVPVTQLSNKASRPKKPKKPQAMGRGRQGDSESKNSPSERKHHQNHQGAGKAGRKPEGNGASGRVFTENSRKPGRRQGGSSQSSPYSA
ncbi:DEAD/DEAH box helicase [Endozoicomonas sp.]|uniref:DEAD/DEAH box helicase n=1 Tax=Endozoicomonas sp. TaxID=1892382 RepID=UPI00383B1EC6